MLLSKTEYRDYIFSHADDRERQVIQHRVFKPVFVELINRLFDQYALAEKINQLNRAGQTFKVLDFACGEGLFLHDIAEVFEAREAVQHALFFGIDVDQSAIITANDYCQVSQPPRPYLHYYVHDAHNPLENAEGLFMDGRKQFDFIFAIQALEHISGAQECLQELYKHLAPGGLIYVRDLILTPGEDGWKMPHPAMNLFGQAYAAFIAKANQGVEVARTVPSWLQDLGAQLLEAKVVAFPVGGTTQAARDNMRNILMGTRHAMLTLVASGMLTQEKMDNIMDTLFKELNQECVGQLSYFDTLATKPLS